MSTTLLAQPPQPLAQTPVAPTNSQNETVDATPSDLEVLRRAYAIRSSWTANERIHRRREADQRFNDLLAALALPQEAA
ncbi:MAG: hypothetical protein AAF539_08045 [Planctomycetota bacterium]